MRVDVGAEHVFRGTGALNCCLFVLLWKVAKDHQSVGSKCYHNPEAYLRDTARKK